MAGLGALLVLFTGALSTMQAQASTPTSLTRELPRFTLRQIVVGRNDSIVRISGPWLRAAAAAVPDSQIPRRYRSAAADAGVEPLRGRALTTERSQHLMGLYHRAELRLASRRTLDAIRSAIPAESTRARFDRIFRPQDEWVVDLHDAALAWARHRMPGLEWATARPALKAAHWIPPGDSIRDQETVLRALYGLAVLEASDSAAFAAAKDRLAATEGRSRDAVLILLDGYTEGQRWYLEALRFFLTAPWIAEENGRSIQDYVRAEWRSFESQPVPIALPHLVTRWFGHPQAVPQYGVPPELFRVLVSAGNAAASAWLHENGQDGLLRTLRWLPPGDSTPTLLRAGSETLRLTTVSRQSRESLNGFLEPRDAIAIDPGYSPLLALGAVVHEWQHLLFRRRQLERLARTLRGTEPVVIRWPGVQPHLAEGFAEWSAERILAPVTGRWPLLALAELEKRADLIQRDSRDPHVIGYMLVHALADAVRNPATTAEILLRNAEQPSEIDSEPLLRRAWARYRDTPDHILRAPRYQLLVPEVTFTIEDGFPDVVATRILAPDQ